MPLRYSFQDATQIAVNLAIFAVGMIFIGWMMDSGESEGQQQQPQRVRQSKGREPTQEEMEQMMKEMAAQQRRASQGQSRARSASPASSPDTAIAASSSSSSNEPSADALVAKQEANLLQKVVQLIQRAQATTQVGDFASALPYYDVAIANMKQFIEAHPERNTSPEAMINQQMTIALFHKATCCMAMERYDEGLKALDEVEQNLVGITGPEAMFLASQMKTLKARGYAGKGEVEKAKSTLEEALTISEQLVGPEAVQNVSIWFVQATVLTDEGDYVGALTKRLFIKKKLDEHEAQLDGQAHSMAMQNALQIAFLHSCLDQADECDAALEALIAKEKQPLVISLLKHYSAARKFAREDYSGAVTVLRDSINSTSEKTIQMESKVMLLAALDELFFAGDDEAGAQAAELRKELAEASEATPVSMSRFLFTKSADVVFEDPQTAADKYEEKKEEEEEEVKEEVKEEDEDDDDDDEIVGAAEESDDDDEIQGAAPASDDDEEEEEQKEEEEEEEKEETTTQVTVEDVPEEDAVKPAADAVVVVEDDNDTEEEEAEEVGPRQIFGHFEIALRLIAHPVKGVKLNAGNHLVVTFENPESKEDALFAEHTLTEEDIKECVKSNTKERKETKEIKIKSPGAFGRVSTSNYTCTVDIFEDSSCDKQLGVHNQLIFGGIDSKKVKTFAGIEAIPSKKRVGALRSSGIENMHSMQ